MAGQERRALSRRRFLGEAAALAAVVAWTPALRLSPAQATIPVPPGFPPGIPLYQATYENWGRQQRVDAVWTCTPAGADDVVTLANWAQAHGYRLRARGAMHGWSPTTLALGETGERVVLVDTTVGLAGSTLVDGGTAVRAGAGERMLALLTFLEDKGLGFTSVPATGDVTVGGVLAIDGHGASIPAEGEPRPPGHTYGSLSNLVVRLTAVVWDPRRDAYALRTFERAEPDCAPLLTNLGRGFVTDVTFRVGTNPRLQCESITDVPVEELLAPPGAPRGTRTMDSYLREAGRAEILWFPFGDRPWLKVWRDRPTKPLLSREVSEPYNYPFSDRMPDELAALAADLVRGNGAATPLFNRMVEVAVDAGLAATASRDIWGASKNVLLYIGASTLRVEELGRLILVRRDDVQRALHDLYRGTTALRDRYVAEHGLYPINMPVEIRMSGLDDPAHVGIDGATSPSLSALRPPSAHPDRVVGIWFNPVTLTGTPGAQRFFHDLEQWMLSELSSYATLRPEWSKGWAFSPDYGWSDPAQLDGGIAELFSPSAVGAHGWDWAVERLDRLDPARVFTNPFLDRLLRPSG